MDMEDNQKNNVRKAVLLLIFLVGFALLTYNITDISALELSKDSNKATTCSNDVVDKGYDDTPVFLDISQNGEITAVKTESKGSVLGTNCSKAFNSYKGSSACVLEDNSESASVTGWVSTNASVVIAKITVPVRLLSGIYSVKDSNRKLTYDNPIYKPAGEVFDEKQILVNTTPGEGNSETKKTIIDKSIKQDPYSTKYSIETSGEDGDGEVVIDEYADNNCGAKCNNLANNNPDKSNKAGQYLKQISYSYPNQKDNDSNPNVIAINGDCKKIESAEIDDPSYKECWNVWQVITGTLGSIFPSSDWTNCDSESEGCINSEDIVIKMSPMFNDTNSFTTTRNKTAENPVSSSSYKSVYVMTPCSAKVAGKLVDVKCAWDMSYLFDERKVSEFDDVGKSETPTHDEYVKFLRGESSTRQDLLLPM